MDMAILVHGFNVWDGGRGSVGKLRPFFADVGIPYLMVNYGWFGIGRTYLKNRKISRQVASACKAAKILEPHAPIILVGHSNGCAIIYQACNEYEAVIDKAVFINPALEDNVVIPSNIRNLDVWYSPSDLPVKWSKYLPFHPWGEMGRVGYQGPEDSRVRSFNKETDYRISSHSHSDVFSVEKLPYFGPIIVNEALQGL